MKSTVALTLLATVAFHQAVLCQEDQQGANAIPALPTLNTDIYWWKTLLKSDELSNYLTGPATEAATATQNAIAAEATPTGATTADGASTTTDGASTTTDGASTTASSATAAEEEASLSIASIESSVASVASDAVSSAASDISSVVSDIISTSSAAIFSTPSVAVGSSWSSSYAAPTIIGGSSSLPRPSGSIIPPVTTSGAITPSNSGSLIAADIGRILFSITIAAVLGNLL